MSSLFLLAFQLVTLHRCGANRVVLTQSAYSIFQCQTIVFGVVIFLNRERLFFYMFYTLAVLMMAVLQEVTNSLSLFICILIHITVSINRATLSSHLSYRLQFKV